MNVQGTEEWRLSRLGRVSASRIIDVTARTKTGYGATRATYMADLLVERVTGKPTDYFVNQAMRDGTEREPEARVGYEFIHGLEVTQVGFLLHPRIEMAGASPDGLVGDKGLVEIKCPTRATHLDRLLGAEIPLKYVQQMLFQMAVTEREWCDFVSYHPDFPSEMQIHVKRVERDDKAIKQLEEEVEKFLDELDAKERELRSRFSVQEIAAA